MPKARAMSSQRPSQRRFAIRFGVVGEADGLKRIAGEAYSQYLSRMATPPAPMLADYAGHLASDTVLVAETASDKQVVGFAVVMQKSTGYWLENIAVADGWRGHGIGGGLLAAVEAFLAGKTDHYQLYTNAVMRENLVWYQRLGFEETGRRDDEGYERVFFKKGVRHKFTPCR